MIQKMILDEAKTYHRNLSMCWIDYKKAHDSVPNKWILNSMQCIGLPDQLLIFLKSLMSCWSTQVEMY